MEAGQLLMRSPTLRETPACLDFLKAEPQVQQALADFSAQLEIHHFGVEESCAGEVRLCWAVGFIWGPCGSKQFRYADGLVTLWEANGEEIRNVPNGV